MPEKLTPTNVLDYLKTKYSEYDFSKFNYKNQDSESIVICKEHGETLRKFRDLRRTFTACAKCASNFALDTSKFLEKIKEKYPKTWNSCDYSKTQYVSALKSVVIECKIHGEFSIEPARIMYMNGMAPHYPCAKCNIEVRIENQKDTRESFLTKLEIAGLNKDNKDNFSKFEYIDSHSKSEIICKDHGSYWMSPGDYLNNDRRCPHCSSSRKSLPELELFNFIKELAPDAQPRVRNAIPALEMDIFIPSKKIGVEYNGLFFHREINILDRFEGAKASKTSLLEKTESAEKAGIFLIHIFEDEWLNKKEQVKARLRSLLDSSDKIFARKCVLRRIFKIEAEPFENQHHLQGYASSASHRYGLFHEEKLVATMSFCAIRFGEKREGYFELLRYCSSETVVGGFSKLIKAFLVDVPETIRILSYSDRRWSQGKVYEKNGFIKTGSSERGYFWCKGQKRMNRVMFQRHKLEEIFGKTFDKALTEKEIMYSEGFFQVKDCGQDRWMYQVSKK